MKLTARQCAAAKPTGKLYRLSDHHHGLMLVVGPWGAKSWIQRLRYHGTRHDLSLGSYSLVTLAEARAKAIANKQIVLEGGDPRQPKGMTFEDAARSLDRLFDAAKAGCQADGSGTTRCRLLANLIRRAG